VIGVINRDQRVNAGRFRGFELVLVQFAPVGWQRTEVIGHQPDSRLLQIDQLDSRHARKMSSAASTTPWMPG
jgi:hypothetical protein